jgi:hypothetical protein
MLDRAVRSPLGRCGEAITLAASILPREIPQHGQSLPIDFESRSTPPPVVAAKQASKGICVQGGRVKSCRGGRALHKLSAGGTSRKVTREQAGAVASRGEAEDSFCCGTRTGFEP